MVTRRVSEGRTHCRDHVAAKRLGGSLALPKLPCKHGTRTLVQSLQALIGRSLAKNAMRAWVAGGTMRLPNGYSRWSQEKSRIEQRAFTAPGKPTIDQFLWGYVDFDSPNGATAIIALN